MKRLNKEYGLDVSDSVVLKYGSVNKDNPQVIYITGKCWIKPTINADYDYIITSIKNNMRKDIKYLMTNNVDFDDRFIFNFSISMDDFLINKKKFMSFDFYLRQKETNKKPLKKIGSIIGGRTRIITDNMIKTFKKNGFQVEKQK